MPRRFASTTSSRWTARRWRSSKKDGQPTRLKATVEVRPAIALRRIAASKSNVDAVAVDRGRRRPQPRGAGQGTGHAGAGRPAGAARRRRHARLRGQDRRRRLRRRHRYGSGRRSSRRAASFRASRPASPAWRPARPRTSTRTFRTTISEATLAGKTAVFTVTLHEVKEFELPADRRRVRAGDLRE